MARKSKDLYYYEGGELHFRNIIRGGSFHRPIDETIRRFLTTKRQATFNGGKRVACVLYYREMVALNDWLMNWTDELVLPSSVKGDTVECYGDIPGLTN